VHLLSEQCLQIFIFIGPSDAIATMATVVAISPLTAIDWSKGIYIISDIQF